MSAKINIMKSVAAGTVGGTIAAGSLVTIGTGANLAVVAAPIAAPLVIVLGAGYVVSQAWSWLFD